jgi:hypothetical protein
MPIKQCFLFQIIKTSESKHKTPNQTQHTAAKPIRKL